MTGSTRHHWSNAVLVSIVAGAALTCSHPALAWGAAGHRIIAAIAWENLQPETREEVISLLRKHPEHERWTRRPGHSDNTRKVFVEASTWADEIRQDTRFYSAGKNEPTPTLPGFPDMERRNDWHYVNIPLNESPDGRRLSGQIERRLPELASTLATSTDDRDRAYALPWLIHLVGDAHQPLHTSARIDAQRKWEKGGNNREINNPFNSRKPLMTLHAFWDDLPGPPWLRGERLDQAVRALIAAYPRPPLGTSSGQWIRESWTLARDDAYPPGNEPVPEITRAFYENSREIANRRITEAGYRLADLLNRTLDPRGLAQR